MTMPLTPEYTPQHQKSIDAYTVYERQLEQIRLNGELSAAGKQSAIAALWGRTAKAQTAAQAELVAERTQKQSELQRKVYGLRPNATPAELTLYRSAVEQASTVTNPSEAIAQIKSAALSGDTILAKAMVAKAIEIAHSVPIPGMAAPWADVVNAYTETNPADEASVEALWNSNSTSSNFASDAAFATPPKPAEVQNWPESELVRLAD
ncbi:hypothetical protein ACFVWR_15405 [Leifsonia sp. NPDC058292]|uniref:hypothetical protein n=1 Tax=Leifsonia sp. NPDC058292 TaxID=3346428 RepID=UPI0036DEF5D0